MTRCPDAEGLLHVLDGTASPAGRAHAAGCPACARRLDAMGQLRTLARRGLLEPDPPVARLLVRAKRRRRALRVQQALGTAAGLLLCAVLCVGEAVRARVERPRLAGAAQESGDGSLAPIGSFGR